MTFAPTLKDRRPPAFPHSLRRSLAELLQPEENNFCECKYIIGRYQAAASVYICGYNFTRPVINSMVYWPPPVEIETLAARTYCRSDAGRPANLMVGQTTSMEKGELFPYGLVL